MVINKNNFPSALALADNMEEEFRADKPEKLEDRCWQIGWMDGWADSDRPLDWIGGWKKN